MTDGLILTEHRPAADGTRPLQVGQRLRSITPALLEDEQPRDCWSLRMARQYNDEPPMHCRRQVNPGEHYLLWTDLDINGRPTGKTEAYCAPCAIAEWHWWQVTEGTL